LRFMATFGVLIRSGCSKQATRQAIHLGPTKHLAFPQL